MEEWLIEGGESVNGKGLPGMIESSPVVKGDGISVGVLRWNVGNYFVDENF